MNWNLVLIGQLVWLEAYTIKQSPTSDENMLLTSRSMYQITAKVSITESGIPFDFTCRGDGRRKSLRRSSKQQARESNQVWRIMLSSRITRILCFMAATPQQ